jgi:hypothetical protein
MKHFLLTLFIVFSLSNSAFSQLPSGSVAPAFSVTDLDGNTHDLYAYLNSGVSVVIDVSATWCGPCWSYHNSGTLENFYNTYGPSGTGDVMVIFAEGDPSTNLACLYGPSGCVGGTQGDWVTGTPYPITHTGGPQIASLYQIAAYPTIFMISAGNQRSYTTGGGGVSSTTLQNYVLHSFKMSADATTTDAVCGSDGEVDLTITEGYGSKTYSWSNGASSQDLVGVSPGVYICTITDQNGYTIVSDPIIVGGIDVPVSAFGTLPVQPSCYGGTDGSVGVLGTAGNGGYSYLWDDGQTTSIKMNVGAGEHYVTVTDALGCSFETVEVLGQPTPVAVNVQAPNIPCGQSTGTATLTASGGSGPYLYSIGTGTQSSGVFNNLTPGTYNYSVADNQNCDITGSFTLTATGGPIAATAASGTITCANPQTQVSGNGSATGSNITYLWTTQNGVIVSGQNELVATVSAGGTYTLQVTNTTTNCASTSSILVAADLAVPSISVNNGELTCVTNSVQLCATTDPNYSVTWVVNGQNTSGTCITVSTAGTYPASVTGSNGCSNTVNAVVTASGDLPSIAIAAPESLTCTTTQVTLQGSLTGDVNEHTILWTTTDGNIVSGANTLNPVVNADGAYNMQVTKNSTGCVSNSSVNVAENINTANGAFQYTLNGSVFNGQASASGSTTTYAWDFGNGTTSTLQNPSVTLAPGDYNVCLTVTTECGSNTVCQSVTNASVLSASATAVNITCHGDANGQASANVSGGVEPITYAWTGPNGYTATTANISNLQAGVYTLVVTDASNANVTQTVSVSEPDAIAATSISIVNAQNNQNNGSINMANAGGTGNLTYLWSNGATTQSISNLSAGDYSCVVTDEKGCSKSFGPFTVENASATDETKYINHFKVYPNPTNYVINLDINFVNSNNSSVDVINNLGTKVMNKTYNGNIKDNLDVSHLNAGIYFVIVRGDDFNIARKVIVTK